MVFLTQRNNDNSAHGKEVLRNALLAHLVPQYTQQVADGSAVVFAVFAEIVEQCPIERFLPVIANNFLAT